MEFLLGTVLVCGVVLVMIHFEYKTKATRLHKRRDLAWLLTMRDGRNSNQDSSIKKNAVLIVETCFLAGYSQALVDIEEKGIHEVLSKLTSEELNRLASQYSINPSDLKATEDLQRIVSKYRG